MFNTEKVWGVRRLSLEGSPGNPAAVNVLESLAEVNAPVLPVGGHYSKHPGHERGGSWEGSSTCIEEGFSRKESPASECPPKVMSSHSKGYEQGWDHVCTGSSSG